MKSLRRLFALCWKEWISLLRDWHALGLLFLMPVVFILILSLGLEGLYQRQTGIRLTIGVWNEDKEPATTQIISRLHNAGLQLTMLQSQPQGRSLPKGFEAVMLIPEGFGKSLEIIPKDISQSATPAQGAVATRINILFANNLDLPYRFWLRAQVHQAIISTMTNGMADRIKKELPELSLSIAQISEADRWISPKDNNPLEGGITSPLQLNVPGWALFAMFMISLPLATGMVRERRDGLLARFSTMPLRRAEFFAGKLVPYTIVNIVQFALMLWFGLVLVPRWTQQPIIMHGSFLWLTGLVLTVAFASTTFGIAVGAWSQTPEQASALAGGLVVVASALGGIMVPVFAMPHFLQQAAMLSPLYWAHTAAVSIMTGVKVKYEVLTAMKILLAMGMLMLIVAASRLRRT